MIGGDGIDRAGRIPRGPLFDRNVLTLGEGNLLKGGLRLLRMDPVGIPLKIGAKTNFGSACAGLFPIGFVKPRLLGPLAFSFGFKFGGANTRLRVKALDLIGAKVGRLWIAVDLLPIGNGAAGSLTKDTVDTACVVIKDRKIALNLAAGIKRQAEAILNRLGVLEVGLRQRRRGLRLRLNRLPDHHVFRRACTDPPGKGGKSRKAKRGIFPCRRCDIGAGLDQEILGKIGKVARLAADYHDALGNLDRADPLRKPGIQAGIIVEAADHQNGPAGRGRQKA